MGNTRLRARVGALLPLDGAGRVRDPSLDTVEARLRTSQPVGDDGSLGDRREELIRRARTWTREALRATPVAYSGPAREAVRALLWPYDLADVVTLVRASARRMPADEVASLLHAVGAITPQVVRSVLTDNPEATLARLAATRLLGPRVSREILAGREAFDRTADLAEWESRVAAATALETDAVLIAMGSAAAAIRGYLADVRDEVNLLAALQARTGYSRSAPAGPRFLPTGMLAVQDLLAITEGADVPARVPPHWAAAVQRHLDGPPTASTLEQLARSLAEQRLTRAAARFRRGDPLGADVPIGYLARVELHAAALRRTIQVAELGDQQTRSGDVTRPELATAAAPSGSSSGLPPSTPNRRTADRPPVAGEPEDARRDWPGDLLVVVPPWVAPGFRLAGTRVVSSSDATHVVDVVQAEVRLGAPGVVAVHAGLWADIPVRVRAGWESLRQPLILALPDETADTATARRERVRSLLARSVGYEITFLPEGESG